MRRRLVAFLVAFLVPIVAITIATSPALAWYFPEHVVLTGDGHGELPREIRAVIEAAIADARKEGFSLCERSDLPLEDALFDAPLHTPMLRTPRSVACVPYAALSGLAGDHAADVAELRTVLTTNRGIELVSTVAFEWQRFTESAKRGQASLDRMSFVHELDVALYFLDPGYVTRARATRAHFRDAGRSFETVLDNLRTEGRIDEVIARFIFHQVRSLILARTSRRAAALLDHAFAVHFLQDAFAAGHLVMSDASWAQGRDSVRWRHDAFNADGLPVRRAMSREPCSAPATGILEVAGLTPCWTTSGDGYLSLNADASDRLHAAAALSRAEVAFAMALDPDRVLAYAAGLGDLEIVAFAAKLDPTPWWTVDASERRNLPAGPKHAMRIVRSAAAAASQMSELPLPAAAGVDTTRETGAMDPAIITGVLDSPHISTDSDEEAREPTTGSRLERHVNPGYAAGLSLLRPTLAQVPTPQADTSAMLPEGHLDHGWAIQIFAAAGATLLVPPRSPVDFMAPAVGLSGGFSYRWGTLLPGRRARAIAEVNLGVSQMLHVDTTGRSGGSVELTFLDQELRWPVIWEALTQYTLPLDLAAMHHAGRVLFFNGARSHEVVGSGSVAFVGIEIEAMAFALSSGRGSYPLYALSPELRFYVGLANPHATQPSFPPAIGPTFGVTLIGGYANQL